MKPPVFELEGVEHRFGDRRAVRVDSFRVEPESVTGIFGPNGAGKSTLLYVMAFLLTPARGNMRFLGQPVAFGDPALRRRAVLLPQDPALLKRPVAANVGYGLKLRGLSDPALIDQALALVGLDPPQYLARSWRELSGGETRRVALAARLALRPAALLLDEPTASLDPESAVNVRAAILGARQQQGCASVVVSHDREWLESVCDVLYQLTPQQGLKQTPQGESSCAP